MSCYDVDRGHGPRLVRDSGTGGTLLWWSYVATVVVRCYGGGGTLLWWWWYVAMVVVRCYGGGALLWWWDFVATFKICCVDCNSKCVQESSSVKVLGEKWSVVDLNR